MENIYPLADACARQLGASVLSVEEYDSDMSILRVSDGQTASALAFGLVEPEVLRELEGEPYQEALWRPLFSTKRGWTAFEKLREEQAHLPETLDSDDFDPFFAEYAIETLAEALKFDADAARGFAEESDAEPVWRWPEEGKTAIKSIPWMPEDAPPALVKIEEDAGASPGISFISCGGRGRGLEAIILPRGFALEDYRIPKAFLKRIEGKNHLDVVNVDAEMQSIYTEQGRGWRAVFPNVEIPVGIPETAAERCEKKIGKGIACFWLRLPVLTQDKLLPYRRAYKDTVRLPGGKSGWFVRDGQGNDCVLIGSVFQRMPYIDLWVRPLERENSESGQKGVHASLTLYTHSKSGKEDTRYYQELCEAALKNKETDTQI